MASNIITLDSDDENTPGVITEHARDECPLCKLRMGKDASSINLHYSTYHPGYPIPKKGHQGSAKTKNDIPKKARKKSVCPFCGITVARSHISVHHKRYHNSEPFIPYPHALILDDLMDIDITSIAIEKESPICSVCGESFANAFALYQHVGLEHRGTGALSALEKPGLFCPFCRQEFPNAADLEKHKLDEHGDTNQMVNQESTICQVCYQGVKVTEMEEHMANHQRHLSPQNSMARQLSQQQGVYADVSSIDPARPAPAPETSVTKRAPRVRAPIYPPTSQYRQPILPPQILRHPLANQPQPAPVVTLQQQSNVVPSTSDSSTSNYTPKKVDCTMCKKSVYCDFGGALQMHYNLCHPAAVPPTGVKQDFSYNVRTVRIPDNIPKPSQKPLNGGPCKSMRCKNCSKVFVTEEELSSHDTSQHPMRCGFCELQIPSRKLAIHLARCHKNPAVGVKALPSEEVLQSVCQVCGEALAYLKSVEILNHITYHVQGSPYQYHHFCTICRTFCDTGERFLQHIHRHKRMKQSGKNPRTAAQLIGTCRDVLPNPPAIDTSTTVVHTQIPRMALSTPVTPNRILPAPTLPVPLSTSATPGAMHAPTPLNFPAATMASTSQPPQSYAPNPEPVSDVQMYDDEAEDEESIPCPLCTFASKDHNQIRTHHFRAHPNDDYARLDHYLTIQLRKIEKIRRQKAELELVNKKFEDQQRLFNVRLEEQSKMVRQRLVAFDKRIQPLLPNSDGQSPSMTSSPAARQTAEPLAFSNPRQINPNSTSVSPTAQPSNELPDPRLPNFLGKKTFAVPSDDSSIRQASSFQPYVQDSQRKSPKNTSDQKKFRCSICSETFDSDTAFVKHAQRAHPDDLRSQQSRTTPGTSRTVCASSTEKTPTNDRSPAAKKTKKKTVAEGTATAKTITSTSPLIPLPIATMKPTAARTTPSTSPRMPVVKKEPVDPGYGDTVPAKIQLVNVLKLPNCSVKLVDCMRQTRPRSNSRTHSRAPVLIATKSHQELANERGSDPNLESATHMKISKRRCSDRSASVEKKAKEHKSRSSTSSVDNSDHAKVSKSTCTTRIGGSMAFAQEYIQTNVSTSTDSTPKTSGASQANISRNTNVSLIAGDITRAYDDSGNLARRIVSLFPQCKDLKCFFCSADFTCKSGVEAHLLFHHGEKRLGMKLARPCPECREVCKNFAQLKEHIGSKHVNDHREMMFIKRTALSQWTEYMYRFMNEKHQDKLHNLVCWGCRFESGDRLVMEKHIYQQHEGNKGLLQSMREEWTEFKNLSKKMACEKSTQESSTNPSTTSISDITTAQLPNQSCSSKQKPGTNSPHETTNAPRPRNTPATNSLHLSSSHGANNDGSASSQLEELESGPNQTSEKQPGSSSKNVPNVDNNIVDSSSEAEEDAGSVELSSEDDVSCKIGNKPVAPRKRPRIISSESEDADNAGPIEVSSDDESVELVSKRRTGNKKRGRPRNKRRICPICNKKFDRPARLTPHIIYDHGVELGHIPSPIICPLCTNEYTNYASARLHLAKGHDKDDEEIALELMKDQLMSPANRVILDVAYGTYENVTVAQPATTLAKIANVGQCSVKLYDCQKHPDKTSPVKSSSIKTKPLGQMTPTTPSSSALMLIRASSLSVEKRRLQIQARRQEKELMRRRLMSGRKRDSSAIAKMKANIEKLPGRKHVEVKREIVEVSNEAMPLDEAISILKCRSARHSAPGQSATRGLLVKLEHCFDPAFLPQLPSSLFPIVKIRGGWYKCPVCRKCPRGQVAYIDHALSHADAFRSTVDQQRSISDEDEEAEKRGVSDLGIAESSDDENLPLEDTMSDDEHDDGSSGHVCNFNPLPVTNNTDQITSPSKSFGARKIKEEIVVLELVNDHERQERRGEVSAESRVCPAATNMDDFATHMPTTQAEHVTSSTCSSEQPMQRHLPPVGIGAKRGSSVCPQAIAKPSESDGVSVNDMRVNVPDQDTGVSSLKISEVMSGSQIAADQNLEQEESGVNTLQITEVMSVSQIPVDQDNTHADTDVNTLQISEVMSGSQISDGLRAELPVEEAMGCGNLLNPDGVLPGDTVVLGLVNERKLIDNAQRPTENGEHGVHLHTSDAAATNLAVAPTRESTLVITSVVQQSFIHFPKSDIVSDVTQGSVDGVSLEKEDDADQTPNNVPQTDEDCSLHVDEKVENAQQSGPCQSPQQKVCVSTQENLEFAPRIAINENFTVHENDAIESDEQHEIVVTLNTEDDVGDDHDASYEYCTELDDETRTNLNDIPTHSSDCVETLSVSPDESHESVTAAAPNEVEYCTVESPNQQLDQIPDPTNSQDQPIEEASNTTEESIEQPTQDFETYCLVKAREPEPVQLGEPLNPEPTQSERLIEPMQPDTDVVALELSVFEDTNKTIEMDFSGSKILTCRLTCPLCEERLTNTEMEEHVKCFHELSSLICPCCSINHNDFIELAKHVHHYRQTNEPKENECYVCRKFFKSALSVVTHTVNKHAVGGHCPLCDDILAGKSALISHISVHMTTRNAPKYKKPLTSTLQETGTRTSSTTKNAQSPRRSPADQRRNIEATPAIPSGDNESVDTEKSDISEQIQTGHTGLDTQQSVSQRADISANSTSSEVRMQPSETLAAERTPVGSLGSHSQDSVSYPANRGEQVINATVEHVQDYSEIDSDNKEDGNFENNDAMECEHCKKRYRKRRSFAKHLACHGSVRMPTEKEVATLKCHTCKRSFLTSREWSKHWMQCAQKGIRGSEPSRENINLEAQGSGQSPKKVIVIPFEEDSAKDIVVRESDDDDEDGDDDEEEEGIVDTKDGMECAFCKKMYIRKKPFMKHLKTHGYVRNPSRQELNLLKCDSCKLSFTSSRYWCNHWTLCGQLPTSAAEGHGHDIQGLEDLVALEPSGVEGRIEYLPLDMSETFSFTAPIPRILKRQKVTPNHSLFNGVGLYVFVERQAQTSIVHHLIPIHIEDRRLFRRVNDTPVVEVNQGMVKTIRSFIKEGDIAYLVKSRMYLKKELYMQVQPLMLLKTTSEFKSKIDPAVNLYNMVENNWIGLADTTEMFCDDVVAKMNLVLDTQPLGVPDGRRLLMNYPHQLILGTERSPAAGVFVAQPIDDKILCKKTVRGSVYSLPCQTVYKNVKVEFAFSMDELQRIRKARQMRVPEYEQLFVVIRRKTTTDLHTIPSEFTNTENGEFRHSEADRFFSTLHLDDRDQVIICAGALCVANHVEEDKANCWVGQALYPSTGNLRHVKQVPTLFPRKVSSLSDSLDTVDAPLPLSGMPEVEEPSPMDMSQPEKKNNTPSNSPSQRRETPEFVRQSVTECLNMLVNTIGKTTNHEQFQETNESRTLEPMTLHDQNTVDGHVVGTDRGETTTLNAENELSPHVTSVDSSATENASVVYEADQDVHPDPDHFKLAEQAVFPEPGNADKANSDMPDISETMELEGKPQDAVHEDIVDDFPPPLDGRLKTTCATLEAPLVFEVIRDVNPIPDSAPIVSYQRQVEDIVQNVNKITNLPCDTILAKGLKRSCFTIYPEANSLSTPSFMQLLLLPVAHVESENKYDTHLQPLQCSWCHWERDVLDTKQKSIKRCFCGVSMDNKVKLAKHGRHVHGVAGIHGTWVCEECPDTCFPTQSVLREHKKWIHEERNKKMALFKIKNTMKRDLAKVLMNAMGHEVRNSYSTMDLNVTSCDDFIMTKTEIDMDYIPAQHQMVWNRQELLEFQSAAYPTNSAKLLLPCCLCHVKVDKYHNLSCHKGLVNVGYKCQYCDGLLRDQNELDIHCDSGRDRFFCNVCFTQFDDQEALLTHQKTSDHFSEVRRNLTIKNGTLVSVRCKFCPRIFVDRDSLVCHKVNHERTQNGKYPVRDYFKCGFCSLVLYNSAAFKTHVRLHKESKCGTCDLEFESFEAHTLHLQSCLPNTIPSRVACCGYCGAKGKCQMKHETSLHCNKCKRAFKKRYQLAAHQSACHFETKRLLCKHCCTWFPTRLLLWKHIKSKYQNARKRKFRCGICNVTLVGKAKFKLHKMSTHARSTTAAKPKQSDNKGAVIKKLLRRCEYCKFKSTQKVQLDHHLNIKHKERLFYCHQCGYRFPTQSRLNNHQRSYHGEVFHQCHVCEVRIRSKVALRNHILQVHYQFYHCKLCRYSFESEQALMDHNRQHEDGSCGKCLRPKHVCKKAKCRRKPEKMEPIVLNQNSKRTDKLECPICLRHFPAEFPHLWEAHTLDHVYGNIFPCECCEYKTMDSVSMYRHMYAKHSQEFKSCSDCLATFSHNSALALHQVYCPSNQRQAELVKCIKTRMACQLCDERFVTALELARHNAKIHRTADDSGEDSVNLSCTQCDITSQSDSEFVRHYSETHAIVFHECAKCNFAYCDEDELRGHEMAEHPPEQIIVETPKSKKKKSALRSVESSFDAELSGQSAKRASHKRSVRGATPPPAKKYRHHEPDTEWQASGVDATDDDEPVLPRSTRKRKREDTEEVSVPDDSSPRRKKVKTSSSKGSDLVPEKKSKERLMKDCVPASVLAESLHTPVTKKRRSRSQNQDEEKSKQDLTTPNTGRRSRRPEADGTVAPNDATQDIDSLSIASDDSVRRRTRNAKSHVQPLSNKSPSKTGNAARRVADKTLIESDNDNVSVTSVDSMSNRRRTRQSLEPSAATGTGTELVHIKQEPDNVSITSLDNILSDKKSKQRDGKKERQALEAQNTDEDNLSVASEESVSSVRRSTRSQTEVKTNMDLKGNSKIPVQAYAVCSSPRRGARSTVNEANIESDGAQPETVADDSPRRTTRSKANPEEEDKPTAMPVDSDGKAAIDTATSSPRRSTRTMSPQDDSTTSPIEGLASSNDDELSALGARAKPSQDEPDTTGGASADRCEEQSSSDEEENTRRTTRSKTNQEKEGDDSSSRRRSTRSQLA